MYETIMKRYVKQRVKHKMKLYSTRVSVQQMKEQHNETKRLMKRRRKKFVTIPPLTLQGFQTWP